MKPFWRRVLMGAALAGGCLFVPTCGITTLQAREFLTSSLIRTSVTTFFSIVEAATIEAAADEDNDGG